MRFVLKILASKPNYLSVFAQLTRYNSIAQHGRARTLTFDQRELTILMTILNREAVRENNCSRKIHVIRNFEQTSFAFFSPFPFFFLCSFFLRPSQVFSMRLITMEW